VAYFNTSIKIKQLQGDGKGALIQLTLIYAGNILGFFMKGIVTIVDGNYRVEIIY
jgi:hypothetical protein